MPSRLPLAGDPDVCRIEYAERPEHAVESMRFDPCIGAEDVCEVLFVEPGRRTTSENVAVGTHTPSAAESPNIFLSQSNGADDVTVLLLDRDARALAAWRSGPRECYVAAAATTATEVGFELRSPNWESRFYRADFDTLPAMPTEPIAMLTAAEPKRILVVDLDVGTVRGWSLPAGMDGMRILYVNRDEIAFATQRNPPSIRFYSFARVQLSAFESVE